MAKQASAARIAGLTPKNYEPPVEEDLHPVEVELEDAASAAADAASPDAAEAAPLAFDANLVHHVSEDDLTTMGDDIREMVKADIESRRSWYDKLKKGLERLGVYDPDTEADATTGITRVTHPLILEAATQFQARAMAELLPPGGPVKATIVGEETPETLAQGKRVERYMNYQLTIEDRAYYDEREQMLFLLPFTGSEFDKQYYDSATGSVVSRWVRCDDFVVPYKASSLDSASRYTHVIRMNGNGLRKKMVQGFYADIDLPEPVDTEASEAPLDKKLSELDGMVKGNTLDADREYVLYETHIDYDVPGFEEDIALPYAITTDSDTGKVLSIYRNWKENDSYTKKRIWFTHKKFLPGFGFYGFGLLHAIGNLGDAASEILRILIDSGAFATLQGGFKSIDAKMRGDVVLTPGVWNDTEMTSEELSRAFYTPPWKEPSQVLMSLLGTLVDAGQKFAATTETMTGDAATTGPVGTMVAQIEQGSKVFSGIHKRLHKAMGDEFIHIGELNGENLPDVYPYRVGDSGQNVLRSDFDARVDIVPVSDPNIYSSAQRIAMAQTALQLATQMPDIADKREAAIALLSAMRYANPEKIFPDRSKAERADPVSEGAFVLLGRPLQAYLDQDHASHITVHMGQMHGLPPEAAPVMQAHLYEHMAMAQYHKFTSMGVQLPPLNWGAKRSDPLMTQISPQMEAQLAQASAQAMTQLMDQASQQQPPPEAQASQQQSQAAEQQKAAAFQSAEQQKAAAFQAAEQRKNMMAGAKVDREDAMAGISPAMVKAAGDFIVKNKLPMSPRELSLMSKALGLSFEKVVEAVSRMQNQQGGSQFEQTTDFTHNPARY